MTDVHYDATTGVFSATSYTLSLRLNGSNELEIYKQALDTTPITAGSDIVFTAVACT